MLEQAAVPEPVADAPLERLELGSERHDAARTDFVAVTVDDARRLLRLLLRHRHPQLVQRERKCRARHVRGDNRDDAVRVEQALDDVGLDG